MPASQAHGYAFTPAEQRCRDAMAVGGTKLAQQVGRSLTGCHSARLQGVVGEATDCNDTDATPGAAKVSSARTSLGARAAKKCGSLAPSAVRYTSCPPPCDVEVPQIDDISDAASCLACVVVAQGESASEQTQGNPTPPLGAEEEECHAAIGISVTKLYQTVLKERRRCQKAAERIGRTSTTICSTSDPRGKIARA